MTEKSPRGLSVIVPCFRSAATLGALHSRLTRVLEATGQQWEVILVDDGSADETWDEIQRLSRIDDRVRGIRLARNFGQHNALLAGVRCAAFSISVTIDDDLQNPPEEIPTLLGLIPEHADVVYGTPQRGQHGFLRNSASWITKQALKRSMNTPVASKISAFRAFSTDLRQSFASYWGASVSLDVLLSWGTMRFASVVVRHDARAAGQSGYSLWKLVTHALNMVTGFSTIPLRAATLLGFVFAAGGGASLLFVLIRFIIDGGVVPGFAFLACALSVFSGVQLIVLGVVGEYLGRVFMYVSGSPCYSIADVAGRGRSPP